MYRHGQPNPDSHSTMRVRIGVPMSVILCKTYSPKYNLYCVAQPNLDSHVEDFVWSYMYVKGACNTAMERQFSQLSEYI